MRYLTLVAVAAALAFTCVDAAAASADICYADPVSTDACFSSTCTLTTSSTVFVCPVAGSKTLPQLAAAGWVVVQMDSTITSSASPSPLGSRATTQLVIQRP